MPSVLTITANPAIDVSTATEQVAPTRKLRCSAMRRDAGGGGINVARVVRRLGHDVVAIYPAGGWTGRLLQRLVEQENVRSIAIQVAEETREDFTVLEQKTGQQYRFVLPGPPLAESEWRVCLKAVEEFNPLPPFVVCSGSLPPGVPDDFYARVAAIAKSRGSRMILDTSGAPLAAGLREGVFLVKPNLRELEDLVDAKLPDRTSYIAASRKLIEAGGAQVVALSLGEGGALLVTADEAYHAAAVDIRPVSAVGAGDSFVGGLVSGLADNSGLVEAFRLGVAAGSAAVMNPGTELCHAPDVIRLYDRVKPVRL